MSGPGTPVLRRPARERTTDLGASGGRKIVFPSGVACYTGKTPPAGVPADDEVSIHLPTPLTIKGDGSFSFSGPVTISAEDAQAESPVATTYKIQGRFVKSAPGTWKALGADSSPICQPSTEKHFTIEFDPPDSRGGLLASLDSRGPGAGCSVRVRRRRCRGRSTM